MENSNNMERVLARYDNDFEFCRFVRNTVSSLTFIKVTTTDIDVPQFFEDACVLVRSIIHRQISLQTVSEEPRQLTDPD